MKIFILVTSLVLIFSLLVSLSSAQTNNNSTNNNGFTSSSTPLITSDITSNNDLYFKVTFEKHTSFEHLLFVGSPQFNTLQCLYDGSFDKLNLTQQSSSNNDVSYTSSLISIDNLLNNNLIDKEIQLDTVKMSIPLKLTYYNKNGENNNGYCQSIEYDTIQLVYFKLTATVLASFTDEFQPFLTSIKMYPQVISNTKLNQDNSTFKIEAILESINMTVIDYKVHNQSNSNFKMGISLFESYSNSGNDHVYRFISSSTQSNSVKDFRSTIYFKAQITYDEWQSKTPYDYYVPFVLDYIVVVPPTDQNITLQLQMGVYNNLWSPKTKFSSEERVYSLVESINTFTNYKLSIESSYLCCFTSVTTTPTYDPTNNKYGCTVQDSSMDVWRQLISNYQPTTNELLTNVHTFPSNNIQGFSFKLSTNLFSTIQDRFCYLHANVKLQSTQNRRNNVNSDNNNNNNIRNVHIISSVQQQPPVVTPFTNTYLSIQVDTVAEVSSSPRITSNANINYSQVLLILSIIIISILF